MFANTWELHQIKWGWSQLGSLGHQSQSKALKRWTSAQGHDVSILKPWPISHACWLGMNHSPTPLFYLTRHIRVNHSFHQRPPRVPPSLSDTQVDPNHIIGGETKFSCTPIRVHCPLKASIFLFLWKWNNVHPMLIKFALVMWPDFPEYVLISTLSRISFCSQK